MKLEYKHEAFVFCWIKLQKDWENNKLDWVDTHMGFVFVNKNYFQKLDHV